MQMQMQMGGHTSGDANGCDRDTQVEMQRGGPGHTSAKVSLSSNGEWRCKWV